MCVRRMKLAEWLNNKAVRQRCGLTETVYHVSFYGKLIAREVQFPKFTPSLTEASELFTRQNSG